MSAMMKIEQQPRTYVAVRAIGSGIQNVLFADPRTPADDDYIKNKIRNDIGQFLFGQTKRRPMVLPVVIKV
jgi:mRNA degradation ribonuclease J1/J2